MSASTLRRTFTLVALVGGTALGIGLPGDAARAEDEQPAAAATTQAEKLIADLGADEFDTRARASRELQKMGKRAAPALRAALKKSSDPEVRWRLEQLLLRMDGSGERALGAPKPAPKVRRRPPAPPRAPGQVDAPDVPEDAAQPGAPDLEDAMKRWRKRMDEMLGGRGMGGQVPRFEGMEDLGQIFEQMSRMFEERLNRDGRGGAWFRTPFASRAVAVPGMRLLRRGAGVELHVEETRADGTKQVQVFKGRSLEAILGEHPELRDHAHMDALRAQAEQAMPSMGFGMEALQQLFKDMPDSMGFSLNMGQHGVQGRSVEIRQGADGVKVRIRSTDEEGKPVVRELTAESMEILKKEHPELADQLGGFTIRYKGPRWFFGPRSGGPAGLRPPVVVPGVRPAPVQTQKRFGVQVGAVEPSLASQLGLEPDTGLIISQVVPGSAAAALGLERFDVLLRVNGELLKAPADAARLLTPLASTSESVRLDIVRRGSRQTLTR